MSDYLMDVVTGRKGGKSGGGSSRVAKEAPNTLQSKATLKVLELISAGEIEGPANGTWAKSTYLDETVLQNEDDSFNFPGVAIEARHGLPDQAVINGFTNVSTEVPVGVQVKQVTPVIRTVSDSDLDAVVVTIRIPALTNQDTTNGDLNGNTVKLKISYQPNGGSYITAVDENQGTITGKTTSAYQRQYRINLTGSAPWNIKVERITDDNEAANIANDTFWDSYAMVRDHRLIYPDIAIVGLQVDSALFGSDIPQRAYKVKGIKVQIPSNYDPITREYDGVWDGTFVRAWSNNPAWVLYDLITNKLYGIGHLVDADMVDKWTLYEIAQYCDGMVDDGKGGLEPRFTFNGVLQTQDQALKVLQVVASVYRGMLYAGSEGESAVVTSTVDAPADAVKIFTPANVIDGMFTYASSPAESQHSSVYVTWNDPSQFYSPTIEVVNSPVISSMITQRQMDTVAFACTSRGQAHRLGKWILDGELYEDEQVTFAVGMADADMRPGQIIKIFDPAIADIRMGGRLRAATVDAVTIDAAFEIESGQSYSIDIVMPDGTIETRDITNSVGIHTVLDLDASLSVAPDVNTMFAITSSDIAPRQFRVITVKESSPVRYDILAQLHDPNKYSRVESNIDLPTLNFTKLSSGDIEPPSDISHSEYIFYTGPLIRSAVTISWKASPDSRVVTYQLESKAPGDSNYELEKQTNGLSHTIQGTIDGTWSFRVRAFDGQGKPSPYALYENITLNINGQTPADVTGFSINTLVNSSVLSWDPVTSKNISHYEVRYSSDLLSATWNAAIPVVDRVAKDTTHVVVASRTGTFMIKAVSVPTPSYPQGVYSDNAAAVVVDIDFLQTFNFVEELVEDPGFTGTKVDVEISGSGNLELTEASPGVFNSYGEYYHDGYIDLGAIYTTRVTPNIVAAGNLTTNDVDGWADVDLITNVDGVSDGLWNLECQVSTTNDDPSSMGAVWTAYTALDVGDISARGFRFRTLLWSYFPTVTPSIENLSVSLDMPDIIQRGVVVTSSTADTVVTFDNVFNSPQPVITFTAMNGMATGDYVELDPSNINASGFSFNIKSSGGARQVRTVHWHAIGYGVLT